MIALCDGDPLLAIRSLLVRTEFLEAEAETLRQACVTCCLGYVLIMAVGLAAIGSAFAVIGAIAFVVPPFFAVRALTHDFVSLSSAQPAAREWR